MEEFFLQDLKGNGMTWLTYFGMAVSHSCIACGWAASAVMPFHFQIPVHKCLPKSNGPTRMLASGLRQIVHE